MATGQYNLEIRANTDNFEKGMSSAERSVESFSKETKQATKDSEKFGKKSKTATKDAGVGFSKLGGIVAGLGIGLAFKKMIENTSRQDAALAQLNATLKATGGVSGTTSEELQETAKSLQSVTRYGDETILVAQSILASFKEVNKGGEETFNRATEAILDMSTALGTDLKSSAIQIGKALNDPVGQMSALSRSGIILNEEQKNLIRTMSALGDIAGAQAVILDELEGEFGGSAEAARETLGGALDGLSNAWGDLFEAQDRTSTGMVSAINKMEAAVSSRELADGLSLISDALAAMAENAAKIAPYTPAALFGDGIADAIDYLRTLGLISDSLDEAGEALVETVDVSREGTAARKAEAQATEASAEATLEEIKVTAEKRELDKDVQKLITAQAKAQKKLNDERKKAKAQLDKNLASNDKLIESIEFEIKGMSMTEEALELEIELRKLNADATDKQREAITRAVAERRVARLDAENDALMAEIVADAQEDAASRSADAWEGLGTTFTGVFEGILEDGTINFTGLVDVAGDALADIASEFANTELKIPGGELGAGIVGGFVGAAASGLIDKGLDALGFGEDNDGNNAAAAILDLNSGTISDRTWGNSSDPGNLQSARDLAQSVLEFSEAIGGSTLEDANIEVGSQSGIKYGGESFGQNAEAFLEEIYRDVIEGSTNLSASLKNLLLGFEGTNDEFLLFTESILNLRDNAEIDSIAMAIDDWTASQRSLLDVFDDTNADLTTLIQNFDGSASSAEGLSLAFEDAKSAAYDYVISIQNIGAAMEESAERQAKSIRESVMSEEELRKSREAELDALQKTLNTLTDPAEIEEAGNAILDLNKKIFDSLSEEEQERRAEEFATVAEKTATIANDILDLALDKARTEAEDMNERVRIMLEGAADKQSKAADVALRASDVMLDAANTPTRVEVQISGAPEVND